MKKRKIKNYFKFGILLIGILFTLSNCDKDHLTETSNSEDFLPIKTRIITGNEKDIVTNKLKTLIENKLNKQNKLNNQTNRTTLDVVEYTDVIAITGENGAVNYTFSVEDSGIVEHKFYNLILEERNEYSTVILAEYTMTADFAIDYFLGNKDFSEFQGSITYTQIMNNNPCPPINYPITVGSSGGGATTGGGSGISSGGGFTGGSGGGGSVTVICNDCSRNFSSIKDLNSTKCAGYTYTIYVSLRIAPIPSLPVTNPCPEDTLPIAIAPVIKILCLPGYIKDTNGNCIEKPCDPGYTKDVNGVCVPISLPCKSIKNQLNTATYKEKVEELKGKTHLKNETGYSENKEGNFLPLPLREGGHSLDLKVGSNTKGYIHSHQNDYETGKIVNGLIEINQPIRMFSPADVIQLLVIAKKTLISNIPLDEVYGTIISSSGNYTLKFTGNIDDIVGIKSADDYLDIYIDYINEFGLEEGFLKFIKNEIKIDGISLYKIEDDGQIIQKTMNNDGIIIPVNCN